MIAIDTSAFARFLDGIVDRSTEIVAQAMRREQAFLPPVVVTELLSNRELTDQAREQILALPLLELKPGHWERAGSLRADVLRELKKANVADVLIAQSCIDLDIPLISYDRDFRHFLNAGLKLA